MKKCALITKIKISLTVRMTFSRYKPFLGKNSDTLFGQKYDFCLNWRFHDLK